MKMTDCELISKLRISIGDIKEPYFFSDEQFITCIEKTSSLYSKYRPIKRIGQLQIIPHKEQYLLPSDYQMWISGLENYRIVGDTISIEKNHVSFSIDYLYYANRKPSEIPACDVPFLLDYCMGEIIESTVICKSNERNAESNISVLKIGKGLDVSFDTMENLEKELYSIAERKKKCFLDEIKNVVSGGWY